jgi:hypothetical protein
MMKNKIYILFIGLLGLLVSCEKEGEQVVMLSNPVAPTIVSMPGLTLERNNGLEVLEFIGTPVDAGFTASAKYFLEANVAGNNFDDPIAIRNDVNANSFKITVSDLNGMLLKKFAADAVSSVDFRIRAELVVDAGTGAQTFEYISATSTADVTLYGLPKLDLLNSGLVQKIESALGNGDYKGFVKVDKTIAFTLKDPDTDTEYGGSNGVLEVDGASIISSETGWQILSANVNDLTYSFVDYRIGLIGSAVTPYDWSVDQKMDYDAQTGTWFITIDLVDGEIKFRKNDGWAWNLGGTHDNLTQGGDNLPVTAGNYTITLIIIDDNTGTCTVVKN